MQWHASPRSISIDAADTFARFHLAALRARHSMADSLLDDLQVTLHHEIPICAQMGIEVDRYAEGRLTLRLPLSPNRNHKRTAFAGSLNALCTVTGWSLVYLLTREREREGDIVIRRSSIKYLQPVTDAVITATSGELDHGLLDYFSEMLREKGQAKLDLRVEIPGVDGPAVSFTGSYVVLESH
jgi:thioesterase domain-containing protein